MKNRHLFARGIKVALAIALVSFTTSVLAKGGGKQISLIMMGDLHASLMPHGGVFKDPVTGGPDPAADAGGVARLKTVVDDIRGAHPDSLLLSCGDLTHGSAEAMFTVGDAMIAAMNQFGIDVFTPGNWDFGYGPAVFRNRFTKFVPGPVPPPPFPDPVSPKPAPPANIQVMASYIDCTGIPNCSERNNIIEAQFPTVAINLYNESPPLPAPLKSKRVVPPYRMFEVNGIQVAVIGITAAIVPQQAKVFNIGLRFTQGVEELPGIIDEVNSKGADVIVVQSELGLSQNIEIARRFDDIDVMYSAHTHEITLGALIADADGVSATTPGGSLTGREISRLARGGTIVVETNRDLYVGHLKIQVAGRKVTGFDWTPVRVDSSVEPDPDMKALVARIEEDFVAGDDGVVKRHSFLPGGFCPGNVCGDTSKRGLQLTEDLDTIVGSSDSVLVRGDVLEDVLNNFIADAIFAVTDPVVAASGQNGWTGVDLTMTNGFRFGNAIVPGGDITLRDLFSWFPISPAVSAADFPGIVIEQSLDQILNAVFNRNPFLQRGGWYMGLGNMAQQIDLDNRPFSSSGGRIVETTIGGMPLDDSKRYVFASCYPHGDSVDRVCRTQGGDNTRFFELSDIDNYASALSLVGPKNSEGIVVGTAVKQVAPDAYLHPVHMLRRYLDSLNGMVAGGSHARGRVNTVDSTKAGNPSVPPPVAEPDPSLVQPPQGAGPMFFR